jgi:acyl-coenzyme A thioesterase PaaI-like protein
MSPHTAENAVAEGELIRSSGTLFFAEARLLDPESKRLCATATGTYKKKPRS